MALTVLGPSSQAFPSVMAVPVVEVKRYWSHTWQVAPDLQLDSASVATAGHGLHSCSFRRPYGAVKQPWESDFPCNRTAWNLTGWWVRVQFVDGNSIMPAWLGRVTGEDRAVHGSHGGRSGEQAWVAYGGDLILRKMDVSHSHWLVGGEEKDIGWVPTVNDSPNDYDGNRSEDKSGDSYLYGGREKWTHYDYAEYLLARFLDESDDDGPAWSLGGQVEPLKGMVSTISMGATQTAASILRRLIPLERGLDYVVDVGSNGFVVSVFAISARTWSFGGQTLPANPNLVSVRSSLAKENTTTRIVRSAEHRYGKLRVIGERIVVCCSLWGENAVEGAALTIDPPPGQTLKPRWSPSLEAEYDSAEGAEVGAIVGQSDDRRFDLVRKKDIYRPVYQHYAASVDWDMNGGTAAIAFDASGEIVPGTPADYQLTIRRTLDWSPLLEGVDYSPLAAGEAPVDKNPDETEPDQLPPPVWVFDPSLWRFSLIDQLGISVSVMRNDWGVVLGAGPNHLLAAGHWEEGPTETQPQYDYDDLVTTIAFESDQRFALEVELPGATLSDGVKEVTMEDAHCWVLAPNTVVAARTKDDDIDAGQPLLVTSGELPVALRRDTDKLAYAMAGAISRYLTERVRATIVCEQLLPWGALVGQILAVIEEAGDLYSIEAPITNVTWKFGDKGGKTIIKAGFAR